MTHSAENDAPCRLGYEEHDGSAYCHEHGEFVAYAAGSRSCRDTARRRVTAPALPIHRTEAGWPNCSTCDGGGCLDCTDPA